MSSELRPIRRRNRPAISCKLCRLRKLKCSRDLPCTNCVRSRNGVCTYDSEPLSKPASASGTRRPRLPLTPTSQGPADQASDTPTSVPNVVAWQGGNLDFESADLQDELIAASATGARDGSKRNDQQHVISRRRHKSRLFGLNHWMNGAPLLGDIFKMLETKLRADPTRVLPAAMKCKMLARNIKSHREPSWPLPLQHQLPPRECTDELVDCYLRTVEKIYRIIHVPTFLAAYQTLSTSDHQQDESLLIQIKLVLAIGSVIYDKHFSLRKDAIQWIYDAQAWLSRASFKSKSHLTLHALQNEVLLIMAREFVGTGKDMTWISIGTLVRKAMHMGMHRDPRHLPNLSVLEKELRRRIWNTILELNLQASLAWGGPPLISLSDFDTDVPANLEDEDLENASNESTDPLIHTSMSAIRALRESFPLRLEIAKSLNGIVQSAYSEVLRLDAELRTAWRKLRQSFQTYDDKTSFAILALNFIMQRYLSSLHIPYFALSLHNTSFAYSRKVVLEVSLQLWATTGALAGESLPLLPSGTGKMTSHRDLTRLATCGSGFFRTVTTQASFLIVAEVRARAQEQQGLGPLPFEANLFSVLDDIRTWSMRCIDAGETNVKGDVALSLMIVQIDGTSRELNEEEMATLLVDNAEHALERCRAALEHRAGPIDAAPIRMSAAVGSDYEVSADLLAEWNLMFADSIFSTTDENVAATWDMPSV